MRPKTWSDVSEGPQGASPAPAGGLETIQRTHFADEDRSRAQDDAIRSTTRTEEHFEAYRKLESSFGGRYVAADLFKETFAVYAQDRESRNRYNVPVHNASAVLAAELFRRNLAISGEPHRNKVVLVTGIPGAGKTTTVLTGEDLAADHKMIYEGQLVRPETTLPKIEQVLVAGLQPVVIAVHALPEDALRNTLRRFREYGRGAGIDVMAAIQGNLPEGLRSVHQRFGERVTLQVFDYRDRRDPRALAGWDNLRVLRSEGHREQIAHRLKAELERLVRSGAADPAFERQALGKPPLARGVDQEGAGQHEADRERRELQARDRAQAFLSLAPEEAVQRYPELAGAYAAAAAIDEHAESSGLTAEQREVVARRILEKIAARIAGGEIPTGRLQQGVQAEKARVPGQVKDRGSEC